MDGILYFLNLKLSLFFRVGCRSPTFRMKLYLTTFNNNFLLLLFFCHNELHLRCFTGLKLNILFMIIEYSKRCQGIPAWSSAALLGKTWKTHSSRWHKHTFPEAFCIKYFAFNACVYYFYQTFIFPPNDSPSKTIRKYIYFFIEKALFLFKIFKFL